MKKQNFLFLDSKEHQLSFFPMENSVEHLKNISLGKFFDGDLDLISFVSHELKTPLSTLSLSLDILKEKNWKNQEDKELVQNMTEEVQWMCRFVCDTLDLRHIAPPHHRRLDFQWCEFYPLMEEVKKNLSSLVKHLNIKIVLTSPPPFVEVYMNPVFMRQAISNLLLNALQHSSSSLVELNLKFQDKANGGLVLQVKERQSLKKKGEVFSGDLVPESFGLKNHKMGLVLVQKIIKAHGGRLKAEKGLVEIHLPFFRKLSKRAA